MFRQSVRILVVLVSLLIVAAGVFIGRLPAQCEWKLGTGPMSACVNRAIIRDGDRFETKRLNASA
jgi:hypothetical protein